MDPDPDPASQIHRSFRTRSVPVVLISVDVLSDLILLCLDFACFVFKNEKINFLLVGTRYHLLYHNESTVSIVIPCVPFPSNFFSAGTGTCALYSAVFVSSLLKILDAFSHEYTVTGVTGPQGTEPY
jgi:hypothetical protein